MAPPPVAAVVESLLADAALMEAVARSRERVRRRGVNVSISGIDGSGKTTLSEQLAAVLSAAGVPVRRLHLYNWYRNLLVMPSMMLLNRWRHRRVLIFDRTIHDNVAKFFTARPRLFALLPLCSWLTRLCFPEFDYAFYLQASFDTIRERRPETQAETFARLTESYRVIVDYVGLVAMSSDARLLRSVVEQLAGTKPPGGPW